MLKSQVWKVSFKYSNISYLPLPLGEAGDWYIWKKAFILAFWPPLYLCYSVVSWSIDTYLYWLQNRKEKNRRMLGMSLLSLPRLSLMADTGRLQARYNRHMEQIILAMHRSRADNSGPVQLSWSLQRMTCYLTNILLSKGSPLKIFFDEDETGGSKAPN